MRVIENFDYLYRPRGLSLGIGAPVPERGALLDVYYLRFVFRRPCGRCVGRHCIATIDMYGDLINRRVSVRPALADRI